MRNFVDPYQNLFDVNGKFLVGRLTFLEPNTSGRKLTIYDADGNELDNPIYTTTFGLPKYQVMLQDQDYKVTFEMYIGQGNMESDDNEASWMLYKTVTSLNGQFATTEHTATPTFCDTIAELKALTDMQDGDTALVKGYFTEGDSGADRLYVWHAGGNYADDGGVTIKSTSTTSGAWVMTIPGDYIDVRWYGDLPDLSANPTTPKSNLGQRVRAANAANRFDKNLYFASAQSYTNSMGFYIFDGSNSVSVNQDIICDSGVRFVVVTGTTGTAVTCKELHKPTTHLFVASSNNVQIGGYTLTADWINTSWLSSNDATARNARIGYVIDQLKSPLIFNNCKIKVARNGINMSCTFNNCEMVECYKQIATTCTMSGMTIHTDWFADDYSWSDLTITGCSIKLQNCKDANTYIILKNKQLEADYGDLGEQTLTNANLLAGAVAENFAGTITVNGATELHNASCTISGLTSTTTINAVDTWMTIAATSVIAELQLRRGSISGQSLQVLSNALIENATINVPFDTRGANCVIRNSDIMQPVVGTDIVLINNQIYGQVEQIDNNGVINVRCTGNMFHKNSSNVSARHYLHAYTANSIVKGVWCGNGSSYDDIHWIRLDRTNFAYQDNAHQYSYMNNAEPYLSKWSGRNRPMQFKLYGGYWSHPTQGIGIFSTTTIPFLFYNRRTRMVTAVPRQNFWKMFTVGRGFLCRSGHIESVTLTVGLAESDYSSHKNGQSPVVWTWGTRRYQTTAVLNNEIFGACNCVCRDATGEAEYECSFELANADHTTLMSYGTPVGYLTSSDWESGSDTTTFTNYPAEAGSTHIFLFVDPNFSTGTNPQNV